MSLRLLLDGLRGLGLAHEDVREARGPLAAHEGVRRGLAEVGVDEEGPPLLRGEGERQVHRGERLAFAGGGGGDRDDPRAGLAPGVVEGGADDAVALDEALVEVGVEDDEVRVLVARELRDDAQEGRAEVLAHVVRGLEGVVEVLEEEGEADAQEGAEQDAQHDVAHLPRPDGAARARPRGPRRGCWWT